MTTLTRDECLALLIAIRSWQGVYTDSAMPVGAWASALEKLEIGAAEVSDESISYWWCSACREECTPLSVTFEEFHENCGHPVTLIEHEEASEIERLTRERDEAIAELNNSGLGSALHFAAAAMVERDGLKAENERLRTALDMAPHANGTICAIYDIDWDIETDPPVDAGEPCNCWKREIDAPGGE